jgi:hypothetical protein
MQASGGDKHHLVVICYGLPKQRTHGCRMSVNHRGESPTSRISSRSSYDGLGLGVGHVYYHTDPRLRTPARPLLRTPSTPIEVIFLTHISLIILLSGCLGLTTLLLPVASLPTVLAFQLQLPRDKEEKLLSGWWRDTLT